MNFQIQRVNVKLSKTDNHWKPGNKSYEEFDPEQKRAHKVLEMFRRILNQMTPQNFDWLLNEVNFPCVPYSAVFTMECNETVGS